MVRRKGCIEKVSDGVYRVSYEAAPDARGFRNRPSKVVHGSLDDAEDALALMRVDDMVRRGKLAASPLPMTVAEFWTQYYEPTLANLAPSTACGYRNAWRKHVFPIFGACRLDELRARDIELALSAIDRPGAQERAFKLLRQIVNEAYRDELIDDNPFQRRIRLKRKPYYEPRVLDASQVPAWCAAVHGSPYEAVLLCALFGGLRREEACALFWGDVMLRDGIAEVDVCKALTDADGVVREGPTKTARSTRRVFIAGYAAERLADLKGDDPSPLCPDANGNRMAPNKLSKSYRAMMPPSLYVPMKNLRTSFATLNQRLGTSDSVISRMLGHTNISLDYAHYFAANRDAYMDAAVSFSAMLDGVSSHVSRCIRCTVRARHGFDLVDPVGIEPTTLGLKAGDDLHICDDCPFVDEPTKTKGPPA